MTPQEIAAKIPAFEGLIFTTAQIILSTPRSPPLEIEVDDIRQRLRIKVWKGLEKYDRDRDPGVKKRHPLALERYVFQCVTNEKRDILKQVRRGEQYIEDIAHVSTSAANGRSVGEVSMRDVFDFRYLSCSAEQAFAVVEKEPLRLPSTLTTLERQVIGLLYEGYMQTEVRELLLLSVRAIDALMRSIRLKLADWKPSASERPTHATADLERSSRGSPHGNSSPSPPHGSNGRTPPRRAPSQPVAA